MYRVSMPNRSLRERIKKQGEKVKTQETKSAAARRHGAEAVAHSRSIRKEVDKLNQTVTSALQRALGNT